MITGNRSINYSESAEASIAGDIQYNLVVIKGKVQIEPAHIALHDKKK
jgi:hypothetical protein